MVQICISETSLLPFHWILRITLSNSRLDVKRVGQSLDVGYLRNLIQAITQMVINMEINLYTDEIFKNNHLVGLDGLECS